jgi:hypothetical protein
MIYISYLGVYDGQNFESANTPSQIKACLVQLHYLVFKKLHLIYSNTL